MLLWALATHQIAMDHTQAVQVFLKHQGQTEQNLNAALKGCK